MRLNLPRRGLLALIAGYQRFLSPLMGHQCRFAPRCSDYAAEAVIKYGAARGAWMAARRILRCHPWGGPGGIDPLP